MQIVKIMGGLGNQMFQYAFAKAYSLINHCDVLIDLSHFEKIKNLPEGPVALRGYVLDNYNINLVYANEEQTLSLTRNKKILLPGFVRNLFKIPKYKNKIVYEKQNQVFDKSLLKKRKDVYFEGYFQTEKYFKDYRKELLKDFSLKTKLNDLNKQMLEQIKSANSVSIHVRHGDYLNLQNVYKICSLDYYQKAIDYICQNTENPHFYIFSDDIEWVQENFKLQFPFTIVDINSSDEGYFDLELMKHCKHNIIANSSFSWWAGWLNENPNKIIMSPKIWFVKEDEKCIDRIPQEWVLINS